MQKILINSGEVKNKFYRSAILICAIVLLFSVSFAQTKAKNKKADANAPKITKVDEVSIKKLLVPREKPLLINFWATWCVPCREEFPDLVEIDNTFKGKIDFITISLDDLAEISRDVPKFLSEMKAEMPAYLLNTNEESRVISSISKDWQGGLPFTILYDENGEVVHTKQGKIKPEIVKEKIYELLNDKSPEDSDEDAQLKIKIFKELTNSENPFEKGKNDAQKDLEKGEIKIIRYGEGNAETAESDKLLIQKYGIKFPQFGCKMTDELLKYIRGYNEIAQEKINDLVSKMPVESINLSSYPEEQYNYKKGIEDAKKDIANGKFIIKTSGFGLYPKGVPEYEKENYPVKYQSYGCVIPSNLTEYIDGYNKISRTEIERRFGSGYGVIPPFRADANYSPKNLEITNEESKEKISDALSAKVIEVSVNQLPESNIRSTEEGKEDAKIDIAKGILKIKRYGLTAAIPQDSINELKKKHGIEITETGCVLINTTAEYFTAYNEVMKAEISKRFGVKFLEKLPL